MKSQYSVDPDVGDLGEHAVLDAIQRIIRAAEPAWPQGTVGPGDDAAVVAAPDGRVVISTDAMSQDRDFRSVWPSGVIDKGYSTGWKAAAQNLSDINAMGATSTTIVMALTMPPRTRLSWVENVARGMIGAIRYLHGPGCRLAGGDLGSGSELTLAVTVLGDLAGQRPIERSTATDGVAVEGAQLIHTGNIGWAAAGLSVLETDRRDLESMLYASADPGQLFRMMVRAVRAQLRPRPPLSLGPKAHGYLDAMMDVSDGLVRDSGKLAHANDAQAVLDDTWIADRSIGLQPLARALGSDAENWVKEGGEDYGLLGLIPAGAEVPGGWSRCGVIRSSSTVDEWSAPAATSGGWDHFGQRT